MSKIISLKEDKEPKKTMVYVGGPDAHHAYFFKNGHGIDCFHRLNIPANALKVLYRIAKLHSKAKAADTDDIERISEEEDRLWKEYQKMVNDPYGLDIERTDEFKNIAFILYDYDYEYDLVHHKDGWSVCCRLSFYKDLKQPYVDMDEPDAFYDEHEKQDVLMERQLEFFREKLNSSDSNEMIVFYAKMFWDDYLKRKRDMHSKDALKSEVIDSIISSNYYYADGKRYRRDCFNMTKSSLSKSANAICSAFKDLEHLLKYLNDDSIQIKCLRHSQKVCNDFALTFVSGIGDVTSCQIIRAMRVKYLGQEY